MGNRTERAERRNVNYQEFLDQKQILDKPTGFQVGRSSLNPKLFDFQKDLTAWALQRGRAALFADCGLGKTPIQLDWAQKVSEHENGPVLIFAPLAVGAQTVREGKKFGIQVQQIRDGKQIKTNGIYITNYEMLDRFSPDKLAGIVLDESSILKSFDGKFRDSITEFSQSIPFRLACTATPSPNDTVELINHAEFLGIMKEKEIKALFFSNRSQKEVQTWVLKKHAEQDFWKWCFSWSVAIRKPSDMGYRDGDFTLPDLNYHKHVISASGIPTKGKLIDYQGGGLQGRQKIRRSSLPHRVRECSELVNSNTEQWLVWCDLNAESSELTKSINGAVEVKGGDSIDHKEKSLIGFQKGKIRVLVTKPSIAGFGLNFQQCQNMAFVGLSDSYERFYQATRRLWRFGQEKPVHCHLVYSEGEGPVLRNLQRKELETERLYNSLIGLRREALEQVKTTGKKTTRQQQEYTEQKETGDGFELWLGDSALTMKNIPDNSIGLSVFSPPFPGMYVYTNSPHDVGNVKSIQELIQHLTFLMDADHLLRITMPGRSCCLHLCQAVAFKGQDGYIGLKDFRGDTIRMMESCGWIYYGEVCIDKDPQVKAIRTKDRGLLFKTLSKDASLLHCGGADYLLQFVKPGDNPEPIQAGISSKYQTNGWIGAEEWIEWAAPVWYRSGSGLSGGIRETDVLKNYRDAKDNNDEKHLAPLQLGVIERAVKLWSNPGDTVFDPFTGIGSTGWVSLRLGRKFKGGELKPSYFRIALKNLQTASKMKKSTMINLFQDKSYGHHEKQD